MDKQTIIGFVLIVAILGIFTWMNRPSEEQIAAQKRYQDSIAQVELARQIAEAQAQNTVVNQEDNTSVSQENNTVTNQGITPASEGTVKSDSTPDAQYGVFASAMIGTDSLTVLENDVLELALSNKGGRVAMARLKNFCTGDSLPLILFDNEEANYGFTFVTSNNRILNTADMYFMPMKSDDEKSVTMRLELGEDKYLDFVYTLAQEDDYMLHFEIQAKGLNDVLASNTNYLDMKWNGKMRQQETGRKFEERYTQLYYKYLTEDVEKLSEAKDDSKSPVGKVKWVAFKGQFFSSVLIADTEFTSVKLESTKIPSGNYLKDFNSQMSVAFDPTGNVPVGFRFYFGPNRYAWLKKYDKNVSDGDRLELDKLVPLGASLFRWINKGMILPMFNFFESFIGNYGLIIFLMTVVIKLLLFPLTYKSYMSSAKMRVLRPQVEEINKKYPGQDKAMERQKATMALYSQAGASPMSGCLPMLLQMPFLIALFMFFPSAIELRQQSFLWAKDLSTFDAVWSWNEYIPFITPYFGNHISLFCVLMTAVNIVYTKFNADATNTGQQQMPGMKYIMYLMPLMFLIIFNEYASGLTYYYLVSTLLTVIQTLLFRQFINEGKLLAKMEENKKKPKKKKGFMARLEEAQRKQQELARQRAKSNKRR